MIVDFLYSRNFLASLTAAVSSGSSSESETTCRPFSANFLCISSTCGKFSLHGPHVVDQTSTKVYLIFWFSRKPALELAPGQLLELDLGLAASPSSDRADVSQIAIEQPTIRRAETSDLGCHSHRVAPD